MDTTYSKLTELLGKSKSIGIVTPKDPNLDQMGAALALYLALEGSNRDVIVATPSAPLVEVSTLVGIDKVKTSISGRIGDLIVSFPYREGDVDKVSYTLEGDLLNIVVKGGEDGLSFNEKDVKFTRPKVSPDLLFIIGASRISDLGKLFDPTELKDTTVVNIDNSSENQGFGDVVMVSTKLSSLSEQIANLIFNLNLKIDIDIAQNLLWGIDFATSSFSSPRTSPLAFEMAGELMKLGAVREQNPVLRTAFTHSASSVQAPGIHSTDVSGQARPVQDTMRPIQQNPAIQNIQEQVNTLKKTTIEDQGSAEKQSTLEAPDDWLAPKIYKGSTAI